MFHRVLQQVSYMWRVDISKTEQSSWEVCWIVVCAEHTPKLFVENTFHRLPKTKQNKHLCKHIFFRFCAALKKTMVFKKKKKTPLNESKRFIIQVFQWNINSLLIWQEKLDDLFPKLKFLQNVKILQRYTIQQKHYSPSGVGTVPVTDLSIVRL